MIGVSLYPTSTVSPASGWFWQELRLAVRKPKLLSLDHAGVVLASLSKIAVGSERLSGANASLRRNRSFREFGSSAFCRGSSQILLG